MRNLAIFASLLGLTGVVLGAFAAHGLKDILPADSLSVFKTGVIYQLIHSVVMLITVTLFNFTSSHYFALAGKFIGAGILLFSGSLYLLVTTSMTWLGPVTPIGGLCFIFGWVCIAIGCSQLPSQRK